MVNLKDKFSIMREVNRIEQMISDPKVKGKTALKAYQRKLYSAYRKLL